MRGIAAKEHKGNRGFAERERKRAKERDEGLPKETKEGTKEDERGIAERERKRAKEILPKETKEGTKEDERGIAAKERKVQ